jgi:hypothetical protein
MSDREAYRRMTERAAQLETDLAAERTKWVELSNALASERERADKAERIVSLMDEAACEAFEIFDQIVADGATASKAVWNAIDKARDALTKDRE